MRAHSTTVDPKCDILWIPDVVLGAGEAMRRREFIAFVGSTAVAWPLTLRAQRPNAVRVIGVLTGGSGPDSTARLEVFLGALAQLGWTENHNVRLDIRRGGGDIDDIRKYAAELAARTPDVIVTIGGPATGELLQATHTVPIVFTIVPDPVASGFVASLSQPGGNATGFLQFEFRLSGKWLELLKEIAPNVARAAVLRDSAAPAGLGQLAAIQSGAPSLGVELTPVDVQNADEIERDVTAFARSSNSGLVVTSSTSALVNRKLIVSLAARLKLPAVYAQREFVTGGGLISYSADFSAQFRAAAGYVDRILKGEKPANLPVQAPTKYELVINLKTANELGLSVPQDLLIAADEVIE
jgi:putative tryptophan/tyrosine transport system substrate-binding protein